MNQFATLLCRRSPQLVTQPARKQINAIPRRPQRVRPDRVTTPYRPRANIPGESGEATIKATVVP